jgi:hypothetical protein
MPLRRFFFDIAGLSSRTSSAAPHREDEVGVLVEPVPFDPRLFDIGARWHCWPMPGESIEAHRRRLSLHLQTLQIAIEDDLAVILDERNAPHA